MERKKLVLEIEVEIPEWAKYVTVDHSGKVQAWLIRPKVYGADEPGKTWYAPNEQGYEPYTTLPVVPKVTAGMMAVDDLLPRTILQPNQPDTASKAMEGE